jgi:hypothetical protein
MIWTPVTIHTISQIEALQDNNLPSTRLELMKTLRLVLQMKCYFPYLKTHVNNFAINTLIQSRIDNQTK